MEINYAQVIVENRAVETDRPFTYRVDKKHQDIIRPGMRVIVPFGRGNKNIIGMVVDVNKEFTGKYRLKSILDLIDTRPIIDGKLLELARWISEYYLASYLDGLNLVMPPGDFKNINTLIELNENLNLLRLMQLGEDEKKIISYLEGSGQVLLSRLKQDLKIPGINEMINKLEELELISINIDINTRVNKKTERWVRLLASLENRDDTILKIGNRARKQIEVINYLYDLGEDISLEKLMKSLNVTDGPIRSLEEKGYLETYNKEIQRNPVKREIEIYHKHNLNVEQASVYRSILENLNLKNGYRKFLIHGVTGSGKTEIYLQLVEEMIERGQDSIILVPEISLTPQTVERFIGRFKHQVAVLHSRLSYGERFDQWRMIKEGRVKIVVGARSAVFAPVKNLGLIIIDEQHEASYKSSNNPKYDTIEVARKRVELENAALVLGTATPSVEVYHQAKMGEYKLLELRSRVNMNFPEISLVDMREELKLGNRTIFSKELYDLINENLKNKRQTILFLNRRGFTSFVSCRNCGYVVKCEDCDVSMTYHKNINRLKCHYCGSTKPIPSLCPTCKSEYIRHFGIGTEQVEYLTRQAFKNARVARMDTDTMARKDSYEKTLTRMKNLEIDILIGTQMISKGLDFAKVTLVGIIAADTSLNLPDFRSSERTFQLTTQVAGRAGRDKDLGRVVVQTYNPDHYSLKHSREHDYIGFYEEEIKIRKAFLYPPFRNIISILVYGENKLKISNTISEIVAYIVRESKNLYNIDYSNFLTGPYPAPLEKIRNNYRWYAVLKVEDNHMMEVKGIIKKICIENKYKINLDKVKISIDINPVSVL